jgi:hypothetical protein
MTLDTAKFTAIVAAAKAKTTDPKWLRAIERAAREILSGEMVVSLFADNTALVTTANGSYRVNGHCFCKAAQNGHTQCAHRAGKRLMTTYEETAPVAVSLEADVAASSRENLIAEIKNIWPRFAPGLPLAVELMARFRLNKLEMLDDDCLRRVRLAIAM